MSTDSFYASDSLNDVLDPEIFSDDFAVSKKLQNIVVEIFQDNKRTICDLNAYEIKTERCEVLTFSTLSRNINPFLWKKQGYPQISVVLDKSVMWECEGPEGGRKIEKLSVDFVDSTAIVTIETADMTETDNQ